jgi:hypothetical protein
LHFDFSPSPILPSHTTLLPSSFILSHRIHPIPHPTLPIPSHPFMTQRIRPVHPCHTFATPSISFVGSVPFSHPSRSSVIEPNCTIAPAFTITFFFTFPSLHTLNSAFFRGVP